MTRIAVIVLLIFAGLAQSADPPIKPTLVTADGKSMPAAELIDLIARQAGIAIDRSAVPKDLKVDLTFKDKPFWEALQSIANKGNLHIDMSGKGNKITVFQQKFMLLPITHTSGPFRFVAKQVAVKSNLESGMSHYDVTVDMQWEPRLAVFRMGGLTTKAEARGFIPQDGGKGGMAMQKHPVEHVTQSGKANVFGIQHPLTIRMRSISRNSALLDLTDGSVTVTAAEKMLRVSFDDLTAKQPTKTVEKVTVTLAKWEKIDDLWEARVELAYPPGMPEFESFEAESWLRENACRLVSPDRSKSFDSKDQLVRITPTGAVIDYRFPEDKAKGLVPGKGWHLEIDTPSPLKEFAVPFELKNIPLP